MSSATPARTFSRSLCLLSAVMLLGSGCRKEEITSYQIPKGSESPMAIAAPRSEELGPPQIKFQTPAGWQQVAPEGMSLAQFSIGDHQAEFSVMSFPGEGVSQLSIVNIVREKAGLAPLTGDELKKVVEPVAVGDGKGSLVNLAAATKTATNNSPNSVMVTVYPHGGATYFFKLSGISKVVEAQKPALLDFLKSVSFVAGSPIPAMPAMASEQSPSVAQTPTAPDSVPQAQASEPLPHDPSLPSWDVPASWREVPPTEMLLAKFVINNSKGAADVTISSFPGDVGGALANVNRWRGMVKLPPIGSGDLDKSVGSLEVIGGKATLVDVNGQGAKSGKATRLIGVIWPRNGQTWFYKLMGDAAVAESEKAAFEKFVQSVRYPQ